MSLLVSVEFMLALLSMTQCNVENMLGLSNVVTKCVILCLWRVNCCWLSCFHFVHFFVTLCIFFLPVLFNLFDCKMSVILEVTVFM